jgi:hypothetical protein
MLHAVGLYGWDKDLNVSCFIGLVVLTILA